MTFRSFFASLLTFAMVFSVALASEDRCAGLFLNLHDKLFRGFNYKKLPKPKSLQPVDIYPEYSPNDIFIGIAFGHTYFVVGDYRYDGGMGINLHSDKVRSRNSLSFGVVLRIKNAPLEIVEKLNQLLSKGKKPLSLTCSQGVCSFLRSSGVKLPLANSLIPSRFLEAILKQGITTKDGQLLSFDLITLGIQDIETSIANSRIAEALLIAMSPFGLAAAGAGLYLLL